MKNRIILEELYEQVRSRLEMGVHNGRFYKKENGNWTFIASSEFAMIMRGMYSEEEQKLISSAAIREVQERLLQDPYVQLEFVDDKEEGYICLANSVFDVKLGKILADKKGDFSYYLNFDYIEQPKRMCQRFDLYIESVFPEEAKVKRKLLLQILGYCLSDLTKAKAAFFFIGESNSGKSTMLELIKRILPERTVTSIPLYRMENRFNLARLAEARVNICSEITEKSFAAVDIFKMLTSNETITAEHKGGKPFEFRLKCKSLNAGNVLPDLKATEGMEAIINRMILLIFPVSVPKKEQDIDLLDKLYRERDSIFSCALDELYELGKNNFCFAEPKDSKKLKKQMLVQGNIIQDFLRERCIFQKEEKIYTKDLYAAFQEYCEQNLLECRYTTTKFSQALAIRSDVEQKKMRIRGGKALSGVRGIRLKTEKEQRNEEDKDQDSDLSYENIRREEFTGTMEQWNKGGSNEEERK